MEVKRAKLLFLEAFSEKPFILLIYITLSLTKNINFHHRSIIFYQFTFFRFIIIKYRKIPQNLCLKFHFCKTNVYCNKLLDVFVLIDLIFTKNMFLISHFGDCFYTRCFLVYLFHDSISLNTRTE